MHDKSDSVDQDAQGNFVWHSDGAKLTAAEYQSHFGSAPPAGYGNGEANSATGDSGVGGVAKAAASWAEQAARKLGLIPNQIIGGAAGSDIDTTQSDQDRQQQQDFMRTLQSQAATGDGAWQENFKHGIESANANAQSMGQTQANSGGNYSDSLRNIGNAQGSVAQRSIADESMLREQAKQSAEDQLQQVQGGMGATDVAQASNQAAVRRGTREANNQLFQQGRKNVLSTASGFGSMFMSDGGRVPGKPKVFGDDAKNDTAPAMLSPGEIVLPLSIVRSKNAPQEAADFVRSIVARGPQHFADGGQAGGHSTWGSGEFYNPESGIRSMSLGEFGSQLLNGPPQQAASIENGGKLDTSWSDAARGDMMDLSRTLQQRAGGGGSAAATIAKVQQKQNDERLAAEASAKGPQAATLNAGAQADVAGAGQAGEMRAKDQARGQSMLGKNLGATRALDLGKAQAEQEAGWGNTMTNSGLDLQSQQFARNLVSGAGQGASGLFHALGSGGGSKPNGDDSGNGYARGGAVSPQSIDLNSFLARQSDENASALDDLSTSNDYARRGSASDLGVHDESTLADDEDKWRGGLVGLADGGEVRPKWAKDERSDEGRYGRLPEPKDKTTVKMTAGEVELHPLSQRESVNEAAAMRDKMRGHVDVKVGDAEFDPRHQNAAERMGRFAKSAAGAMAHFAEGGRASYEPQASYDPNALPPRKDNGPVVYISSQPSPGAVPVPKNGAGGASGSDAPQSGAGGGTSKADDGPSWLTRLLSSKEDLARDDATRSAPVSAAPFVPEQSGAGGQPGGNELPPGSQSAATVSAETAKAPPRMPPAAAKTPGAVPSAATKAASEWQMPYSPRDPSKEASDEQLAALAIGESEAQGAHATALAKQAELDVAKKAALDDSAVVNKARLRSDETWSAWQRKNEELARIDTTVDPGRYWASKSTGSKILGIIGLALGALGAGNDGVNKAAVMMGQAIDRDLEAQKAEHTIRLQKGRQQAEGLQSMYAMAHQAFGDEVTAMDAARASAMGIAKMQTEATAAKISEPIAKQKAIMLAAQLGRGAEEAAAKANSLNAEAKLHSEQAAMVGAKGRGPALTPKDKEALTELEGRNTAIQRNGGELIGLINKWGTVEKVEPGVEDKMNQNVDRLATDMAKMVDPSTGARFQEVQAEMRNLFTPGFFKRKDTAIANIKHYMEEAQQRRNEGYSVRGLGGGTTAPQIQSFSTVAE